MSKRLQIHKNNAPTTDQFFFNKSRLLDKNNNHSGFRPILIQNKLTINKSVDKYDLESKRLAETVLQAKELPGKNPLTYGQDVQPTVHKILNSAGQPLDAATRVFMESRFGHDFSKVRVHTNDKAAESARAVNALAFTIGQSIHFGSGQYRPESKEGMKLLAHELAHTVQQQSLDMGVQPITSEWSAVEDDRLEHEADNAVEKVVAGRIARISGSAKMGSLQRQDKDKENQPKALQVVSPVQPNEKQKKMIEEARHAAAIRTQIAMFKASAIEGTVQLEEARRLAQIKFNWANPNMDQISEVLRGMGGGLIDVDVKVAGKGDPECGSRAGYVRGHRPPIILCPLFFSEPPDKEKQLSDIKKEGRTRTMIHEMAHVKGIGKADINEEYFPVFDCESKGEFESADSWANYVHCLSGSTPDKPDEIVVPTGGSKTNKKTPENPTGSI